MKSDLHVNQLAIQKRRMLVEILDDLCQELELTETQYNDAVSRYTAVGEWLAGADSPLLQEAMIYAQGSIALGTSVKPVGRNEFDVDLVCHLPGLKPSHEPAAVKALIGDRLKEHGKYEGMLEEKMRCWRIKYANEFHLDITPAIVNPYCMQNGELVPCKQSLAWKSTNPKGYLSKFEQYAAVAPSLHIFDSVVAKRSAEIEPLPEQTISKPILKRIVQLVKASRDRAFSTADQRELAPISVILTTLAAWSYAACVRRNIYADVFELIEDVIRCMPEFIRIDERNGKPFYFIENETTVGENFAEKWNQDARLPAAFYAWHKGVLASVASLLQIEGSDQIGRHLSESFGVSRAQVQRIFGTHLTAVGAARTAGTLRVAPSLGIVTAPAVGAVTVRSNTFYGR